MSTSPPLTLDAFLVESRRLERQRTAASAGWKALGVAAILGFLGLPFVSPHVPLLHQHQWLGLFFGPLWVGLWWWSAVRRGRLTARYQAQVRAAVAEVPTATLQGWANAPTTPFPAQVALVTALATRSDTDRSAV